MSSKKGTIIKEVERVQDVIQHIYHRISVIEQKLTQQITLDSRESLEAELATTKQVLKSNEEKLLKLRKDNTKSFMITVCIIFIIFLIYGLYSIIFNIN